MKARFLPHGEVEDIAKRVWEFGNNLGVSKPRAEGEILKIIFAQEERDQNEFIKVGWEEVVEGEVTHREEKDQNDFQVLRVIHEFIKL